MSELFLSYEFVRLCVIYSTAALLVSYSASLLVRGRPARGHRIVLLGIVGALLLPVGYGLVEHFGLGVLSAEVAVEPETPAARVEYERPTEITPAMMSEPTAVYADYASGEVVQVEASTAVSRSEHSIQWPLVGAGAWAVVSCVLVVRLLAAFLGGRRLARGAVVVEDEALLHALETARERMGVTCNIELRRSGRVSSPVVWCWGRRPVLVLHETCGMAEIDWLGVLCHELAHVKRRDHLAGLLGEILVCVFPWQVLGWVAKRRLAVLAERACDDWVLACGQAGEDYAESLLGLTPQRQTAIVAAVVRSRSGLGSRVRRILRDRCGNPRIGVAWALLVSVVCAIAGLGAAPAQNGPASQEDATWGETVMGVRMRLHSPKRQWWIDETPEFTFDLHNAGGNEFTKLTPEPTYYRLEVDGLWFSQNSMPSGLLRSLPFTEGMQQELAVPLYEHMQWESIDDGQPLVFEPGTHRIRAGVSTRIVAGHDPDGDDVIASNPIEIEILPGSGSESVTAGETDTAGGVEYRVAQQQSLPAISIAPYVETIGELKDLRITAKAINAYGSEKTVKTSVWEIRTADNSKRVAQLPFNWPWQSSPETELPQPDGKAPWLGWGDRSGVLRLNESQLRRTSDLQEGAYLLAWILNGKRQSNVCRFRIDHSHEPIDEPLLKLSPVAAAPNTSRSGKVVRPKRLLALRHARRTVDDPIITNQQVAYATLNVDGKVHRPAMMLWTGPVGPPKIGGHVTYLLDLDSYEPSIAHDKRHTVVAEINGRQSNGVDLTPMAAAKSPWDIASAQLGPPPEARITIRGRVIDSHGKGAANYGVYVKHEQWKNRTGRLPMETTDEGGRFTFANLPAGSCDVFTNPTGKGQPMLRVAGIELTEEAPVELELNLEHKFTFNGSVLDADNRPVAGREVMGVWKSPDVKAEFNDFATTRPDGRYTLGAPFPVAAYVGLSGTGPQPRPHRDVQHGRNDVDFRTATETAAAGPVENQDDIEGFDPAGMTSLCRAAAGGHSQKVKALLEAGAEVNELDGNLNTALGYAARGGHRATVEALLAAGAGVDSDKRPERTALGHAAEAGHLGVAAVLLEAGADPNAGDRHRRAPLHYASMAGHVEMVKLLIDAGTGLEIAAGDGFTSLSLAASHGHRAVVEVLVAAGANIETATSSRTTPLIAAAAAGHLETVRFLIEAGALPDNKNSNARSALDEAIEAGHRDTAAYLYSKGATTSLEPLPAAAYFGETGRLRRLLAARTDMDSNEAAYGALYYATMGGSAAAVDLLLSAGVDIDAVSKHDRTVLTSIAFKGRTEMVKLLLDRGADVNKRTDEGTGRSSALYMAVSGGHLETAKVLLQHDAEIECKGYCSVLPLHRAAQQDDDGSLTKLLLEHGAEVDCKGTSTEFTPLHWAAYGDRIGSAQVLVQYGADVNSRDTQGVTALYKAVASSGGTCMTPGGTCRVAELLIAKGADIGARSARGETALHWACKRGGVNAVQLLLNHGADIGAVDQSGSTPLHVAISPRRIENARLLISRGAKVNARNNDGQTPSALARSMKKNEQVVALLLEHGATD